MMEQIVEARIEIPMGSQNKYEIDHETGKIKLDRVLYSAAFYPVEYGFIDDTLSMDGDALDILVLTSAPTFPGCYIDSRIIGGMDMIDSGEFDVKKSSPSTSAIPGMSTSKRSTTCRRTFCASFRIFLHL